MLDNLRTLALKLAPELAGRHLTVVDTAGHAEWGGFALDVVRDNIFGADDWAGPGPVVAVDASQPAPAMRGVLIHELAHILPVLPAEVESRISKHLPQADEYTATVKEHLADDPNNSPYVIKQHGPFWIRRVVHLFARAASKGIDVDHWSTMGYADWLSPLPKYLPCLLGQAMLYQFATFNEIDNLRIPDEVHEIHAADVHRYRVFMQREKMKATAAIAASTNGKVK